MDEGYEEDGGATIESLAGLYRCVRELLAERDHLEADLHRERVVKRINDVALLNAVSERDRLRAVVDAVRAWGDYREPEEILDAAVGELLAERDRLRAVVDAARMVLTVIDSTLVGRMANGIEGRNEITLLRLRLDQLDGSAEATDG
jgi:hypothetical protein